MAMRNSVAADGGSSPSSATPPNRNRVMPRIGMPRARPTTAWPNSCSTMHPKKASAVTRPMIQITPAPGAPHGAGKYSWRIAGKPLARLRVNRARMMSQLASTEIGMPSRRNRRQRAPNMAHLPSFLNKRSKKEVTRQSRATRLQCMQSRREYRAKRNATSALVVAPGAYFPAVMMSLPSISLKEEPALPVLLPRWDPGQFPTFCHPAK